MCACAASTIAIDADSIIIPAKNERVVRVLLIEKLALGRRHSFEQSYKIGVHAETGLDLTTPASPLAGQRESSGAAEIAAVTGLSISS